MNGRVQALKSRSITYVAAVPGLQHCGASRTALPAVSHPEDPLSPGELT